MSRPLRLPSVPAAGEPRAVTRMLVLAEARLLVRSPLLRGAALLSCALGIALEWLRMQDWTQFSSNAGEASMVLAAALFLAAHLAMGRDRRCGTSEGSSVLPAPVRRRVSSVLVVAPVAAVVAALVVAGQLLALWPDWPAGALAWPALLVAVAVPMLGGVCGAALGQWVPATAAGPLGLGAAAAMVLTLPVLGAGRNHLGLSVSPLLLQRVLAPGRTSPAGWHLVYLLALAVLACAITLLRHRRLVSTVAGTLAVALAVVAVAAQVHAYPNARTVEVRTQSAAPIAYECEQHTGVEYCALPGYRRWIALWTQAVDPVVAALPAVARAGLPSIRQYSDANIPQQGVIGVSVDWGRHSGAAGSRARLATWYAQVVLGLPYSLEPGYPLGPQGGGFPGCWAGGQARTVAALWLAAQALPDGRQRLAGFRLGLYPSVYDQRDIDAALVLLDQPRERVGAALAAHWSEVDASGPGTGFLTELGIGPLSTMDGRPACP